MRLMPVQPPGVPKDMIFTGGACSSAREKLVLYYNIPRKATLGKDAARSVLFPSHIIFQRNEMITCLKPNTPYPTRGLDRTGP